MARTARIVAAGLLLSLLARPAAAQPVDSDRDGLPDSWEIQFGLDPRSAATPHGADDDPDGDGITNRQELAQGSHPRGLRLRWLAEGASNSFFRWRLALANPEPAEAHALITLLTDGGALIRRPMVLPPRSHRTLTSADIADVDGSFSTTVETDLEIAVDRTMTWANGTGSHAEGAAASPGRHWYLAEGATHGAFNLFYLIQNPSAAPASVRVNYYRPSPLPWISSTYTVPAHSRFTIWVDEAGPGLESTDVSAEIISDQNIVVERAMYMDGGGTPFRAGHAAAAVSAPALEWYLAEGATGGFFDLYLLIANPTDQVAIVEIDYLLPDGMAVPRDFQMAPRSRSTVRADDAHPWLNATPVSVRVRSKNQVPIVVERSMWWPDGRWIEAHVSAGATAGGTRWLVAGGEESGAEATSTYTLIANISDWPATVDVSVFFENGGESSRTFTVPALSRFTVDATAFPESRDRRFAVLVESRGAQPAELVVERSVYSGPGWEAGTSALGANLSSPLRPMRDLVLFRNSGVTQLEMFRPRPGGPTPTFSVSATSGVVSAQIDAATGRLRLTAGSAAGVSRVTVAARVPGEADDVRMFDVTVSPARLVQFGPAIGMRAPLFPAAADVNGDGFPELIGTVNDGAGNLTPLNLRGIGLGPIVDRFATFDHRENHPVDVNGDGRVDLLTWTYLPITDPASLARLLLGQPDGTYVEDPSFAALGIRGYGHGIVTGDVDNDGDVDLFMVDYTHNDPREQLYLLLNDGQGHFRDVADAAGVATRNWRVEWKAEGAQAVDVDSDGDLDLFVASHFFFNEGIVDGVPRFVDRRAALGLPLRFDEGLKFLDADNDGRLDLLLHHPSEGPQLWRFDGTRFTIVPLPITTYDRSYGANVYDMNNDGLEDIVLSPGCCAARTRILLNTGSGFVENPLTTLDGFGGDVMAFADFDQDGRIDIARRRWELSAAGSTELAWALNTTPTSGLSTITLDIVGAQGRRDQYGRVVRVQPRNAPGVTYTRVVDGGSGFLTVNQYPILIGTPHSGTFDVTVRFADAERHFVVQAGQRMRLFADGRQAAY